MMDSNELDRAYQAAITRVNEQQAQQSYGEQTPSQPAGVFVPGTGLTRVRHNYALPSAAHQQMKYEPQE